MKITSPILQLRNLELEVKFPHLFTISFSILLGTLEGLQSCPRIQHACMMDDCLNDLILKTQERNMFIISQSTDVVKDILHDESHSFPSIWVDILFHNLQVFLRRRCLIFSRLAFVSFWYNPAANGLRTTGFTGFWVSAASWQKLCHGCKCSFPNGFENILLCQKMSDRCWISRSTFLSKKMMKNWTHTKY